MTMPLQKAVRSWREYWPLFVLPPGELVRWRMRPAIDAVTAGCWPHNGIHQAERDLASSPPPESGAMG